MSTLALTYIESIAWAITVEAYEVLHDRAARIGDTELEAAMNRIGAALEKRDLNHSKIEAVMAKGGTVLDKTKGVIVRPDAPNVAIIPVIGPIYRYANIFTMVCGGTSIDFLARDIQAVEENSAIESALFYWDTPGGEYNGSNEQANRIAAMSKPTASYISGDCCSGGLWLASATDERILDAGATIGSLGVVMSVPDARERARQRGQALFVSSDAENKRPDLNTQAGRAYFQKLVDDYTAIFRESVAKNLGMSGDEVVSRLNRGGVLIGAAAVDAGVADDVGSFEQVLSELSSGNYAKKKRPRMVASGQATNKSEVEKMATEKGFFARLFGGKLTAEDKKEIIKAAGVDADADGTVVPNKPEAGPPPPPPASDAGTNSSELARIKAALETERNARFKAEAEAFADLITGPGARKALPAERDSIVVNYIIAAQDDVVTPRTITFTVNGEAKQGTRVDAFKAAYAARPPHNLTGEFVPFDASTMQALDSNTSAQQKIIEEAKKQGEEYAASANRAGKK